MTSENDNMITVADQIIEEKCWGRVAHLFHQEDHAAVSYLEVKAGYRCSRHYHKWRANQFSVVSGCIIVETWDVFGNKYATKLQQGQSLAVPSGVEHRFRVLEDGVVIEVYWMDTIGGFVSLDDIIRFDEGGLDDA